MKNPALFVGLDVGGSSMKAGVVNDEGQPLSAVSLPTEAYKGQAFGLERMCETIRLAVTESGLRPDQIAAIGVATPGTMDLPAGLILDPPNLYPWQNVPVRQYVQDTFRVPTAFQNDANAAAFGEYWIGAGKGARSMVLFTLGTGVGGGIIIGDLVVEGEHSHGAELGHMKIEMTHPRQCGCGRVGCLEAYASATAVAAGDALGQRIVEETAFYLAVGATNLMHTIDPDMVVFGGGMIAAGESFLERIRGHIRKLAFPVPAERTQIRYAQLGSDAGFIGAAACGRQLLRTRRER
jgi:glucokinase